jgi:transposase
MTDLEQKIVALIRGGMRAPEIAERLGCNVGTVYTTATKARLSTITGKSLDIDDKDKRRLKRMAASL